MRSARRRNRRVKEEMNNGSDVMQMGKTEMAGAQRRELA